MRTIFSLIILGILIVIIGYGIGAYLAPVDTPERSDAIVAVSGGDTEARTLHAVALYNDGLADELIFSGDALDPISKSNAQAMKEIAIDNDVPAADIRIEESAKNTAENARNTAEIITDGSYEKVILVTSPYHQRRAYLEFKRNVPDSTVIFNSPASDKDWSRGTWFLSFRGIALTLSELPKTIFLQLQTYFSWTHLFVQEAW